MASRTLITGKEGGGGEKEEVGASGIAYTNTGRKTSIHHTIFFLHCNVVTREELEHRLLDQLSEKLQVSEVQLREEMARKVSDGPPSCVWMCYHNTLFTLHVLQDRMYSCSV